MFYGRLLNPYAHNVEALCDFPNPVILVQGRESRGYCFIEGFCCDINRVLDITEIPN
jgi:hypothetical protein